VLPPLAASISYKLKNALPMFLATDAGVDYATKPSVCLDDKVVALLITTYLGTGWALPDHFLANFAQACHGQAVSSVLDGRDGISQLHSYLGAPYTLFYTPCTELRSAVPRPKRLTTLDQSSVFHAVKVTFM
jgi:hypothetical protein